MATFVTILVLLGLASSSLTGFRRLRALQQNDFCEPLDYSVSAIPNCISCPACTVYDGCTAACDTCREGFFVNPSNQNECSGCLTDCKDCVDATSCKRCAAGKFFFATPTPACQGSTATCGSKPPEVFQPEIDGGLSLIQGATRLIINARFSNYFYNVEMNYRTCGGTTITSGPAAPAGQYCNSTWTATVDYLNDCSFNLESLETTYIYRGTLDIEVNYDVYFLGVVLPEPGYIKRPIGWRLTLNKLLTSSVAMTIKNDDQCEQAYTISYGSPTESVRCNGQGCAESSGTDAVTGTKYLECVCDACHTGPFCDTDTCAPTPTCPSGLLTINLAEGQARTAGQLNLLDSAVAFVPSATDNSATGWSSTNDTNITITRTIGAGTATVVQSGGFNTDNLLTMVWDSATYALDTEYTVTYGFDDKLGGPLGTCSFRVMIKDVGKPSITCPGNKVQNTMPTWSMTDAVASDNIDAEPTVIQVAGVSSSSVPENTQQSITLRATDSSGNYNECTFSVTYDTTPPTVVCPADYAVNANVGSTTGTYVHSSWAAQEAQIVFSDALSGLVAGPVYGTASGDPAGTTYRQLSTTQGFYTYQPWGGTNIGVGGRTYTHTDLAGNSAVCIVRVKVTDVTPPTVSCPPTQNKVADGGSDAVAVSGWAALFTSSDNVGVTSATSIPAITSFAITSGQLNDAPFNVTYTAKDAGGLSTTCYTLVYVEDTQVPTITCPAALTAHMDTGANTYTVPGTVPWGAVTAADNDGLAGAPSHNAPASLVAGANSITYTATDYSGLKGTCSFTVTVQDTEKPQFTRCPSTPPALTRNTEPGENYWTANFKSAGVVTYTDNVQINEASLASDYLDNTQMFWTTGSGPITVHYSVKDTSNNEKTCNFTVNIVDNEAPVIQCSDQVITTDDGSYSGTASSWSFAASDNADTTIVAGRVAYNPSGLTFAKGTVQIRASITDEDLNTGFCDFMLTVNQKCGDLYVEGAEGCEHESAGDPTIGIGCTLACSCNAAAGYFSKTPVGRDCLYRLQLNDGDHTMVGAAVAGGGSVIVNAGGHIGTEAVFLDATPDVSANTKVSQDFLLTKTALGVSFNTNAGSSETLNAAAGKYALVKVCPAVNNNQYSLTARLYQGTSTGVDTDAHCSAQGAATPARFYREATGCWEFAVCGSGLVVFGMTTGNTLDWLQCDDTTLQVATTTAGQTVAVAFDKDARTTMLASGITAGASLVVSTDYGCPSGPTDGIASPLALPPGTHTLTIKASNGTTVGGACSFTVTVTDGVAPTLTGCSATQAVSLPLESGANYATYTLPSVNGVDETTFIGSSFSSSPYQCLTDDTTYGIVPTADFTNAPGGTYAGGATATLKQGTTTFTWSVTDGTGNGPTTCIYTVTVADKEAPVLTCPPVTITTILNQPTGTLATTPVTVTDNLDAQRTANAPVGTYAIGRHTISYSTSDAAGNVGSCTFTLTVNDQQAPTLTCPSAVSVDSTAASQTATWSITYSDNDLANTQMTSSFANGSSFDVFTTTTITVTVKDQGSYPYAEGNHNSAVCKFNVTVNDVANPVLTCPGNVQISTNVATGQATWTAASITDNDVSPAPTIVSFSSSSGDYFPVKLAGPSDPSVTTVTVTGRDATGNTGTCQFTVTVLDSGAPYFVGAPIGGVTPSCPSNVIINSGDEPAGATGPWWTTPVAVDYKGVTNSIAGQQNPSRTIESFALGDNVISYMAQDAASNQASCTFNVTVRDTQGPAVACHAGGPVNTSSGSNTGQYTFTLDATDDYSTWSQLSWSSPSGHGLPNPSKSVTQTLAVGAHTLRYEATDAAGNVGAECSFSVTIQDNEKPLVTCPTSLTGSVGAAVSNDAYKLYKRIPGPSDTSVAVGWPQATVSDNNGAAGITTTYSPAQDSLLSEGTHTVTATATDAAGNSKQCSFSVEVWKPYAAFNAQNAYAAVSRMVITETATKGQFEAAVQYVTQVPWPYLLDLPNALDFPSQISNYYEDLSKRNCVRLVNGAGVAQGVYESVNTFCYQYWTMKVSISACDQVSVGLNLKHMANCYPGDCEYTSAASTIDLMINAGNLCETDLGTVTATASLFVLGNSAYAAWSQGLKNEDPTGSTAFGATTQVNALVRTYSNEVNFESVAIYAATRRTFATQDMTGTPTSETTLIADEAVSGGSGFTVNSTFQTGKDWAAFKYTEKSLGLQKTEYVKLTVTVIVSYQLTGTTTRRRMVDVDLDVSRRDMLQENGGSVGVDASASLSVITDGVNTRVRKDTTTQPFMKSLTGVVIVVLASLLALLMISICVAFFAYRRGVKKGQNRGQATFKEFMVQQRNSIIQRASIIGGWVPKGEKRSSIRDRDTLSSSKHSHSHHSRHESSSHSRREGDRHHLESDRHRSRSRHESDRHSRHESDRHSRHESHRHSRHESDRHSRQESDRHSRHENDRHSRHESDRHSRHESDRHRSSSRDRHESDRHARHESDCHRSSSRDRHENSHGDHRSSSRDRHESVHGDHRSSSRDRHESEMAQRSRQESSAPQQQDVSQTSSMSRQSSHRHDNTSYSSMPRPESSRRYESTYNTPAPVPEEKETVGLGLQSSSNKSVPLSTVPAHVSPTAAEFHSPRLTAGQKPASAVPSHVSGIVPKKKLVEQRLTAVYTPRTQFLLNQVGNMKDAQADGEDEEDDDEDDSEVV